MTEPAFIVRNVRTGIIVPASFKPGFPTRAAAESWISSSASDPFAPVPASEFEIEAFVPVKEETK